MLVYISSFGELPRRYHYELESPPLPGVDFPYRVAGRGDDVTSDELEGIVREHLKTASPP